MVAPDGKRYAGGPPRAVGGRPENPPETGGNKPETGVTPGPV
jgi:hypothetical protein